MEGPPFSLQSHRRLRTLFERFLAISFVVQLLDSFAFTGLLWARIEDAASLDYSLIFAPLWLSNLLGITGSAFHIGQLWHLRYPLGVASWPDSDRNLLIGAIEAVVDEVASTVTKILMLAPLSGAQVPLLVVFVPLWIAVVFQLGTFFQRRPTGKGAFLIKPRYIMAAIVACRVDNLTQTSWLVQFVPMWLALGAMSLVLVTALCTGLLALSVQGEPSAARSTVFAVLWLIGASLTTCGFVFCERLAERLDGDTTVEAYEYMVPMLVAEASLLVGTLAISVLLRKIRRQLQSEQVEREVAARAAEEDILLQFVQAPDEMLVRHSSTLFRRYLANDDEGSSKVTPINPESPMPLSSSTSAASTITSTAAALVNAAVEADIGSSAAQLQSAPAQVTPVEAAQAQEAPEAAAERQPELLADRVQAAATAPAEDLEDMECIICFTCQADAVFFECGHGGVCIDCAEQVAKRRPAKCPICRQAITQVAQLGERRVKGDRILVNIVKIASLVPSSEQQPLSASTAAGGDSGSGQDGGPGRSEADASEAAGQADSGDSPVGEGDAVGATFDDGDDSPV